ncbi:hypothetical protein OTK49_20800 [Vibrio coralliirubri]|uniref:hypothetical protein n=1 Tax=Vibrio coralliirubri TaxID=1516159 RepID=UPI0022836C4D|nr:hypothetical protein [Vibrio coralliirubri]MCY9864958.1 hypothetical protein [Vibrio coralliirubri]
MQVLFLGLVQWFIFSPISTIMKKIAIMGSTKTVTLFHGSNVEFERFEKCGVRSTSALGVGYYLTPRLEKAERYGDIVMAFEVDVSGCLPWDDLSTKQRRDVEDFLIKHVPSSVLSKYGEIQYEVVPLNPTGLARTEELRALTESNENDASRARMVSKYDSPDHLKDIDRKKFGVVRWRVAGRLDSANNEQLLALAQEYAPEIASHLGYMGAMFGDEVAIYRSGLAVKVGVLKEDAKFELVQQNKKGFWAVAQGIAKEEMQNESKADVNRDYGEAAKPKSAALRMRL